MRKLVLCLAMSLDGFIIDENGQYDWISGDGDGSNDSRTRFSYPDFLKTVDPVIMGRVSYESDPLDELANNMIVVATRTGVSPRDEHRNTRIHTGDIVEYVNQLMQEDGKDIFLYGGGGVVDAFMKADLIDRFIVGMIPMIVGSGTKLFLDGNPRIPLHLDRCSVEGGITVLEYSRR